MSKSPLIVVVCGVLILVLSVMLMMDRNTWRADANKTHDELKTMTGDRDDKVKKLKKTTDDLNATKQTLEQTAAELKTTKEALEQTTTDLATTKKSLEETTTERDTLKTDLASTKTEAESAKKSVEDLTAKVTDLKSQVTTLSAAKAALEERAKLQEAELDRLKGKDVALPSGLHGKVLAVDKVWNFVVIDIGRLQGALPGGKMIIGHTDKSVGIVKLVQVLDDKSIADVVSLNDPKLAIQPGDDALTQQ